MNEQEPVEKPNPNAPAGDSGENGEAEPEGSVVIALTVDEFDAFQKQLADARVEAEKQRDSYHRALADYNNLRRRTEQEREQMRADLTGKILNPFLDVLDDLDLAVRNRPLGLDAMIGWVDGIELVYRKLLGKLEAQGVQTMDVSGAEFDPHFHEAISHEPNDEFESGQIIGVVKPGYMIGDRVLKPALVRVAS
jgi:molecular chaperone GrpE